MTARPQPQSGIDKIKLYTPGDKGRPLGAVRKLSSNENLYGPSPLAVQAIMDAAKAVAVYPSVDHVPLRQAIAAIHNLPVDQLIIGVGSDEILAWIAQAYAGEGDQVIMTEHGFEVYGIVTHAVGAELITVAEDNRRVDIDAIITALSDKTKIIYVANPANPTGTFLNTVELKRLIENVPTDVLVVLDGAYAEFADDDAGPFDGGASLVPNYPNVIMTRTFSKLYGLGGLRVGWAFADQAIVDTLNRIRGPFNMSNVALAGAKAAIEDQHYAQDCRSKIVHDRDWLIQELRALGLGVDDSYANFVTVRFDDQAQATKIHEAALESGLLLRTIAHYGLPNALRITIGTRADVEAVLAVMKQEITR